MATKVKFYLTSSGRSPVEEFLKEQSADIRGKFVDAIEILTSGMTLSMPLGRNLSTIHSGLHELRLKDGSGHVRIFYFIKKGDAIYMLHAFRKKTQELPDREVATALKRLREV